MRKRIQDNLILFVKVLVLVVAILMLPSMHKKYLLSKARNQVFRLVNPDKHGSGGTGFSVKAPSGKVYTLTNEHVCSMTTLPYVHAQVPNEVDRFVNLKKIESAQFTDLCILEGLSGTNPFSLSDNLSIGDEVAVIGHPLLEPLTLIMGQVNNFQYIPVAIGFDMEDTQCSNRGGKNMHLGGEEAGFFMFSSVCVKTVFSARTTLQTYPGNSGSPVIDIWGKVVGVLFAGNGRTNWGYIIPISDIKRFLEIY